MAFMDPENGELQDPPATEMNGSPDPLLKALRHAFDAFSVVESSCGASEAGGDFDETARTMDIAAWNKLAATCALSDGTMEGPKQLESAFHIIARNGRLLARKCSRQSARNVSQTLMPFHVAGSGSRRFAS